MRKKILLIVGVLSCGLALTAAQVDPYRLIGQLLLPQGQQGDVRREVRKALEEVGEKTLDALIEATYYGQLLNWEIEMPLAPGEKLQLTYQVEYKGGYGAKTVITSVISASGVENETLETTKKMAGIRRKGRKVRPPLKVGDVVTFIVEVVNTTKHPLEAVLIGDALFEGFTYLAGSSEVTGAKGKAKVEPVIRDAAWIRWDAVNVLGNLAGRDPEAFRPAIPALVARALTDINTHPRWRSLWALGAFPKETIEEEVIPRLREGLKSSDDRIVWNAAVAMAFFGQEEVAPILDQGLSSKNQFQRWEAAYCLGMVHDEASVDLLCRIVSNPNEDQRLRQEAVNSLGRIGDPGAIPVLIAALKDPAAGIRWRAAIALANIGDPSVIPALKEALANEKDPYAAQQIQKAIDRLSQL